MDCFVASLLAMTSETGAVAQAAALFCLRFTLQALPACGKTRMRAISGTGE
jgi:hypothetical protein